MSRLHYQNADSCACGEIWPCSKLLQPPPLSTDFSQLGDLLHDAQRYPAWDAFIGEMKNRAYGREAVTVAWLWFREGWDAGVGQCIHDLKMADLRNGRP